MFSDESRFCLHHHDYWIRVCRRHGQRLLNYLAIHRHTGSAPAIIVWRGIRFHCRTPLVSIAGTLNNQPYISEVWETVVLPYLHRLPSAIYEQNNVRPHLTRTVLDIFFTYPIQLFPWPDCSLSLSPIENLWSMLQQ
ncbi:transposable element Tc3 transposase [Trichonephila clavipes]|nr:transposable element Tc3 transposase [Trichonephila clavipes]